MKISPEESLQKLFASGRAFLELYAHGTLSVEIYKPVGQDHQQPHDRDEIYIIISGHGDFLSNGLLYTFNPGDFFFVPAGIEHRFTNFSEDFATWVVFYGPNGGEDDSTALPGS